MTKFRRPQPSVFNTFFDDCSTRDNYFSTPTQARSTPSANIKESDDAFMVEMELPGRNKEDFNLNVENDILTISSEVQIDDEKEAMNFRRREFRALSFKRNFRLSDTIEVDNISADYTAGVLSITLPKNEKALTKPVRQIKVG
jgi:HSP20 family protein